MIIKKVSGTLSTFNALIISGKGVVYSMRKEMDKEFKTLNVNIATTEKPSPVKPITSGM